MEECLSFTNPAYPAPVRYQNPDQLVAAARAGLMFAVRAAPDLASACCAICGRVECEHQRRILCSLAGLAWEELHSGRRGELERTIRDLMEVLMN